MRFSSKKMSAVVAVSAFMLLFAACGNSAAKQAGNKEATPAEAESQAAESEAAPENYGTVKLGNYKGIDLEVKEVKVADDEIQSYLEGLVKSNPEQTEVERAAADGDVVNIDYVGKKDGTAFDGGTASGYDLKLGSKSFIDGFEDGLIGARKGDHKTLNLTFPEQYANKDLAGKAVTFDVTVNAVKEEKEAILSDAWVEKYTNGAQKTVDAYKKALKKQFTEQRKKSEEISEMNQAFQAIIENSDFELAPEAVTYEAERMKKRMEAQITQYGMDMAGYLQMTGMKQEDFDKQIQEDGENEVKYHLVIDGIFDQEGFQLGEPDYKALEEQFGMSKDMLIASAGQNAVDLNARYFRVAKFLLEHANKVAATEAETTAAEANPAAEETGASTEKSDTAKEAAETAESGAAVQ